MFTDYTSLFYSHQVINSFSTVNVEPETSNNIKKSNFTSKMFF